jgi:hypothetical protein
MVYKKEIETKYCVMVHPIRDVPIPVNSNSGSWLGIVGIGWNWELELSELIEIKIGIDKNWLELV